MDADFTKGKQPESVSLTDAVLSPSLPLSEATLGLISSSAYCKAKAECQGCHLWSVEQFVRRIFNDKSISNSSEYLLFLFDERGKCLSRKTRGFPVPSLRNLGLALNSFRLQKPCVQNRCIDSCRTLLFVTCSSISQHDLACLLPCVKQNVQLSLVRGTLSAEVFMEVSLETHGSAIHTK